MSNCVDTDTLCGWHGSGSSSDLKGGEMEILGMVVLAVVVAFIVTALFFELAERCS